MMNSPAEFLPYWANVRERTRRAVIAIPPHDVEWTYAAGRWTFGDIVRHLAGIERDMYAENVLGRPARYPGHGAELAAGLPAVIEYFDRKDEESVQIFGSLTPGQWTGKCITPAGTPITTWKWLRAMVEHEAHHRGQLYLMLGMRGVKVAPLYGLTEEDVLGRSRSAP